MSVTLDGHILFDEQQLEIQPGSFSRGSVERTVPGLDGVLSIDLGGRGRKIKQTGTLQAASQSQMDESISEISAYMDGDVHTMIITSDGAEFDNLRMDSFRVSKERTGGCGVVVDYEITYTQLKSQQ
ncbi:MAG: hypothetical protein AMJ75_04370 [Phycisphaerae bacterium SM1_79]|nr:MAG: hypothetical protein AMJ75_04370 [Phycisphaerae bacterium SM1_79]